MQTPYKHLLIILFTLLPILAHPGEDPVGGIWQTEPGDSGGYLHVRMYVCETKICGTIERAFDDQGIESESYEHLGKAMIRNMQVKAAGSYHRGSLWAPDRDKTYKSKMKLNGDKLTVKGCIAFVCRGQVWQRVK